MTIKLSPFAEYLLNDVFAELEGVSVKRMFGGYGFYLDDQIFGFITDEEQLVMKANNESKAKFEERGGEQFVYTGHKNKGPVAMPYWSVPENVLEDRELICEWARNSAELSNKK